MEMIKDPRHWDEFKPIDNMSVMQPILDYPSYLWTKYKGRTLPWLDFDNEDRWEKHQSDPNTREKLLRLGWTNDCIRYKFNSYGFRCDEFTDEVGAIFLGCSHTGGVGLPNDSIWPTLVARELGVKCWNLGVGGASMDTCFRIFNYFVDKLNVTHVFIVKPSFMRFDMYNAETCLSALPRNENLVEVKKYWYSSEQNSIQQYLKNSMAIEYLCHRYNLKLTSHPVESMHIKYREDADNARDLSHHGVETHRLFAKEMIDMIR